MGIKEILIKRMTPLMMTFLLSSMSLQAETFYFVNTEIDGLFYRLDKATQTAKLSWMVLIAGPGGESYRGINYSGELVVPETVKYDDVTYRVNGIEHDVFEECQFESFTIPASITSIDGNACRPYYNFSIKNLYIPSWDWWFSIQKPGTWSDYLRDYVVHDFLEKADHLFVGGTEYDISEFVFPESMVDVPNDAFRGCSKLKKVTMHDSMKEIGEYAFYGTGLTSVDLPASIETIQKKAFAYCPDIQEFTITDGVKYIGEEVFTGCENLRQLTIDRHVDMQSMQKPITAYNLQAIVSRITDPKDIHPDLFFYCYNNATLYVPEGTIDAYLRCEGWKEFATIKEGDPITGIANNFGMNFRIVPCAGGVTVSGAMPGTPISVFLPDGKMVYKGIAKAGEHHIPLASHQLYFIRTGKKVVKMSI